MQKSLLMLCLSCLLHSAVYAAEDNQPNFGLDSHLEHLETLTADLDSNYVAVLDAYDAHLAEHPTDIVALVERCRFIAALVYSDSDHLMIEMAEQDLAVCETALAQWPEDEPERRLYELSQRWGDENLEYYEQMRLNDDMHAWSTAQKTRLFSLAISQGNWEDGLKSLPYTAFEETGDALFALGAAQYTFDQGDRDSALSRVDAAQPESAAEQLQLAHLLHDLGRDADASAWLEKVDADALYDKFDWLKLHLTLDANHSISEDTLSSLTGHWMAEQAMPALFNLALEQNPETAQAIYSAWTADDFWQDPYKIRKFKLYWRTGVWQWDMQDLHAALGWLATLALMFVVPLIIILPVHYRGLYRRVHNKPATTSMTDWNLRHALFLGAAFLALDILTLMILQHDLFLQLFFSDVEWSLESPPGELSRLYFIDAALFAACALLVFKPGRTLFQTSVPNALLCVAQGIGAFFLFRLVIAAAMIGYKAITLQGATSDVQLIIQDIVATHGLLIACLGIGLITPILEEYLFRGVLLNAFTKHIKFGWANTLQAAVFALIHDVAGFLYLHHFLIALIAGHLVKLHKNLYSAIALHAANNTLAVLVLASGGAA